MSTARTTRMLLGAVGVLTLGYGLVLLLDLGVDNLVATALWAGGGVLVHDALLAPATIVVAALATAALRGRPPAHLPAPLVVASVVLATLTVVAVPVLGRFGARADNPTLLDRDYTAGWAIVAAICAGAGIMGAVVRSVRARRARREET